MPRFLHLAAALGVILAQASFVLAQVSTSVTLRASAALPPAVSVRLRDVATIDGPDADRLGEIVVLDAAKRAASGPSESLSVDDLRAAMERAGINAGRVRLTGSSCTLRPSGESASAVAQPQRSAPKERPALETVDVAGPPTVRVLIARRLATLYGVEPADLRLRFIPATPEDGPFLESRTDDGRRFEVTPGGSSLAGRLGARVEIYAGDRLAASRAIGVEVAVRREACVSTGAIARGDTVTQADVVVESRWLPPSVDVPPTRAAVIGQAARRRIEPGRVIDTDDVRPQIMVERGEEVAVHTLSGGVVLKSKARATQQGREGDVIEIKRDGSKKPVMARVSGKGLVVINLDPTAEPLTAPPTGPAPLAPPAADARSQSSGDRQASRDAHTPRPNRSTKR